MSKKISKEQRQVLTEMLNHYNTAYKFAAECDETIDEALKAETTFADSDSPIDEYLEVQGRGSYVASHMMNLCRELKREIDRINSLLS